ncbi:MAG: hypothetical protein HY907_18410 [Deltaproteobacteria bacterium]|nr:hypothetical protein [Deltaproteobacteria bacterium]
MKTRALAGTVSALLVVAAVATALAQVAPDDGTATPIAPEPDASADAGPAPGPDAVEDVPAAAPEAAVETAMPRVAADADIARVVQRRREASLVGGWVHSVRDEAAGRFTVDDVQLDATGQFRRRQSDVDAAAGIAAAPAESTGTWFTEEATLVLLAQGSAVDEVLRAAFQIDDRSETLVLELPGGPASYFRYR